MHYYSRLTYIITAYKNEANALEIYEDIMVETKQLKLQKTANIKKFE